MFSKFLLVASTIFSFGSNLTLKAPEEVGRPVTNHNIRYFSDLFPNLSFSWNNEYLTVEAEVDATAYLALPDLSLDYFYFGDFGIDYNIVLLEWYQYGSDNDNEGSVPPPFQDSFPFVHSRTNDIYNIYSFSQIGVPFTYVLNFEFVSSLQLPAQQRVIISFRENFGFANEKGIADYIDSVAYDNYTDGYSNGVSDGESTATGGWLGELVFGTVGGIVGLLFAISDFEVLGVSIMSVITLFVAIGIIMLLIKVIK